MGAGRSIHREDTREQEPPGQNLRDVRRVVHCRGNHGSRITKDAIGEIENGFHARVVGLGYDLILVRLETDTPASGDEVRGSSGTSPGFRITTGLPDELSNRTGTVS